MKMRSQILFAQLPTVIIISLITIFFIVILSSIKEKSESILVNNFKSILAMQTISKSIEDINDFYINNPQHDQSPSEKVKLLESTIERQLLAQDKNIKEPGEKELTKALHEKWDTYKHKIQSHSLDPYQKDGNLYKEIKQLTQDVMGLNQDGLLRTKENLSVFISNYLIFITFGSILSIIFGFSLSWFFTGIFLSPLSKMTEIMSQVGKEDKITFLHIKGSDEIEELSHEFNLMTNRLEEYHKGSLGKISKDLQTFKSALDALPDPILLLDPINNFIYTNKPAYRLFGFSEYIRKTPSLFHLTDQWKETLIRASNKVLLTKSNFVPDKTEDTISLDKGNKKKFFLPWAYPIKKGSGNGLQEIEGVVIILQDLMRQPFSETSKTDVYETVIHEFQSPLTDIHMAIHLCVQEAAGPLNERQKEVLFAARNKCDYLEKLCQDLLNLSQITSKSKILELENVDLNDVVLKLITSLQLEASERKIFIHFEEPPYLSKIKANQNQIQTLIGNLLRNAIHYAHPGTIVKIKLREKKKFINLSINNKGPVIPLVHRKNIFKKHFKVPGQSEERSGLGLYIAKQITQSLGGKIEFKSAEKQGTTFWIDLPIEL
ncbi:MAG: hypothetical protein BGO67_09640 [Alphaproteobacteria bacterium 41-28]|nr:MAG: hypothetical protein BGO67_09640 [Alphaproteobacteria bacterium 41-28]